MKKIKLSVVIINYKTPKLTFSALRSLDKYPYSGAYEAIVVDNASGDNSYEILSKFKSSNFFYKLIKNSENSGFSKGNNLGIRKARGEYVFLLNSDAKVTKGALDRLVSFSESHEDAGVVAPRLLNPDGSVQESVFRLPTVGRAFRHYMLGQKLLDKYAPRVKKPVAVESVVGAAFLITPKARDLVGLLNERYFMYFEDLDYCRAVRKAGLGVYYLPDASVIHIHGASGKASDAQMRRLVSASKVYHGLIRYYVIFLIIWVSQKAKKLRAVL